MKNLLLILLDEPAPQLEGPIAVSDRVVKQPSKWHWTFQSSADSVATTTRHGQAQTDSEKTDLLGLKPDTIIVIVPGYDVRKLSHGVPTTGRGLRRAEFQKAALFAVEDKIASPLSTLHTVVQSEDIIIMDDERLRIIFDSLSQVGIKPDYLFADFDVLQALQHIEDQNQSAPFYHLLGVDGENGRVIFGGSKQDIGHGTDNIDTGSDASSGAETSSPMTISKTWADELGLKPQSISVTEFMEQTARHSLLITKHGAVSLLQGQFSRPRLNAGAFAGGVKLAMLSAACALVLIGTSLVQNRAFHQQADTLEANSRQVFKKNFNRPAKTNPALEIAKALNESPQANNSFLSLSNAVFKGMQNFDAISIKSMRYDQQDQNLMISMIYPSFEQASAFEVSLTRSGLAFQSSGVRQNNQGFVGDAVINRGR